LTALENLQKKVDSKSWTNPISDEETELIEDALYAASVLTAQVRSWNDIHQMIPQMFKSIIDSLNNTIVFGEEASDEEDKQNG
jgi:hypothetical protein